MMLTKIRRSVNHPIRQLEQIGDLGYFDFLNRLAPPPGRAHQAETKEGYGPHQSLSIATCRGRHEQRRPRWGDGIAAPDSLRAAVKPKIFSERLPQAVTRPLGAARPRPRRHGTHRRAARGMREAGREGRSLESGEPVGDFRVGTWRGRALGDLTPFPDRPPPLTWARASDRRDIIGSLDGLSALFTPPDAHDLLVNPRQRASLRPRYEVIQQELSGSERTP